MTYNLYSDAGHAWLSVPYAEIKKLDLVDKITAFSYCHWNKKKGITMVYLEEDLDLITFIKAKEAIGQNVKIKEHYNENSSIRKKYPFSPAIKEYNNFYFGA